MMNKSLNELQIFEPKDKLGFISNQIFYGKNSDIVQSVYDLAQKTYNSMYERALMNRTLSIDYEPSIVIYADSRIVHEMRMTNNGSDWKGSNWMGFRVVLVVEENHLACVCTNPPDPGFIVQSENE